MTQELYLTAGLALFLACVSVTATLAFFVLASWSEQKLKASVRDEHKAIDSTVTSDSIGAVSNQKPE